MAGPQSAAVIEDYSREYHRDIGRRLLKLSITRRRGRRCLRVHVPWEAAAALRRYEFHELIHRAQQVELHTTDDSSALRTYK